MRTRWLVALQILVVAAVGGGAWAQDYPSRPIRLVTPFAPGGSSDLIARVIAAPLEADLKQPVLVENRPGASGMIGVDFVAKTAPDGYTLLLTGGSSIGPVFIKGSTLEIYRDLAPISMVYEGPWILYVQRSVPVNSLPELIAYVKANPGKLNYGTTAPNERMLMEMFKHAVGADIVDVPYKGAAPRVTALLANEVQFAITGPQLARQLGADGKVRALMAFGNKRSSILPDVPTPAEAGFAALSAPSAMGGLWAPLKTPPEIISRLNAIIVKALAAPALRERIRDASGGYDAGSSTAEELRARSKAERDFYVEAAKLIRLEPQ
jgi:tripartite-type tricarboxylate transporter receptor subunit TctC